MHLDCVARVCHTKTMESDIFIFLLARHLSSFHMSLLDYSIILRNH